ncbi:DUF6807 domain-containing protein [Cyclobacterium plantarum]|uniref:Methane oxygenase PmoA n=1 Tax=Cyclobacterium plantarum TaxID=2716263 RepID=A0ABX0H6J7_9BACT|nr:PmoA family protein [Cyclobacterium plantarum]NHE57279.1 hypothetical protein [Cyclobacterium plantarum]
MNKFKQPIVLFLFISFPIMGMAQKIATLEIELPAVSTFAYPVSIPLDPITHLSDSMLTLMEVAGEDRREVPFQIDHIQGRTLYWLVKPMKSGERKRSFEIHKKQNTLDSGSLSIDQTDKALIIKKSGKDLWQYNHAIAYPPEGADPAYARSGFVHPMWSPTGKSLTRIQPPDHYHHYGLWNPWTRAEFKGETIDFWNLKEKQGTVRFANFVSRTEGAVFAGYKVLHEHLVLQNRTEPEIAMREVQGTRIFALDEEEDYYLADISILLNPATDHPVILKEYRYGSLGWRATEKWDRTNSEVITSEGLDRKSADGSLARWCIVQGEIDEDYAAVVMMSYPANYNHPEPLRIWPEDIYDRGDMYANFAPTKNMDWDLHPGKTYLLTYRFLVSSKKISPEEAEAAWQQFAHEPKITIHKE